MVEVRFSIFGEEIRVVTDEPLAVERAVRIVFGICDALVVEEVPPGGFHPPVLLLVRDGELAGEYLSGIDLKERVDLDGIEVEVCGEGGLWLVRLPESVLLMLRCILNGVAAYGRWRFMAAGFYSLHAGGVRGEKGAVVFTGEADSGKTTLVAGFVRGGWDFLADDNLPLSFGDGRLRAYFLGEAIKGMRFDVEELDSLAKRGYRLFGYPGFLTAPRVSGAADVRMIFFLERGEGFQFEELEPGAALVRLLNLCKVPLVCRDDFERYFDFATLTAKSTSCVALRFEPVGAGEEAVRTIIDYVEGKG